MYVCKCVSMRSQCFFFKEPCRHVPNICCKRFHSAEITRTQINFNHVKRTYCFFQHLFNYLSRNCCEGNRGAGRFASRERLGNGDEEVEGWVGGGVDEKKGDSSFPCHAHRHLHKVEENGSVSDGVSLSARGSFEVGGLTVSQHLAAAVQGLITDRQGTLLCGVLWSSTLGMASAPCHGRRTHTPPRTLLFVFFFCGACVCVCLCVQVCASM